MRSMLYLAAALALAGCGGGTSYSGVTAPPQMSPSPPVMTTSVSLRNLAFSPAAIQVAPGATAVHQQRRHSAQHYILYQRNNGPDRFLYRGSLSGDADGDGNVRVPLYDSRRHGRHYHRSINRQGRTRCELKPTRQSG